MSKIILYTHGGSGNHGCEALARATCGLLEGQMELESYRPEEDIFYGVDRIMKVMPASNTVRKHSWKRIVAAARLRLFRDDSMAEALPYEDLFNRIRRDDIALSIGGDNYCYGYDPSFEVLLNHFKKRGAKTVLWGCSIEPESLNERLLRHLIKFDQITARESITFHALKDYIGDSKVTLIPDPAFTLLTQKTGLPYLGNGCDTIGLNISPMAQNSEIVPGMLLLNTRMMVEHILNCTEYNVALIPHVVWRESDDRILLEKIWSYYKDSGRVFLIPDQNCMALKYVISKCRMFIGARTHATIAAYSSRVPTLVIGYSVKARGIAKDIFGTDQNYVVPVQSLAEETQLVQAFRWLELHEAQIRETLQVKIPEIQGACKQAKSIISSLQT